MSYNVLVVDDSAVTRSIISRTIRLSGIPVGKILTAPDGAEGIKAVSGNWVDIVFVDINMPVLDGCGMVERMAADGLLNDTPVVVVTSERNEDRLERLRRLGVSAFIEKPFTPERLRQVVVGILGGCNGREDSSLATT